MVFIGLTPNGFRLRLHAADGAKHENRAIQHPQGTLHLDGEIDMAGGVYDIDAVFVELLRHPAPEAGGRRGSDGDPPLLLLLHPIHGGRAIVDLADFVRESGVIENPLRSRRLTGIDVRHDADIAVAFDGCFAGHCEATWYRPRNSLKRAVSTDGASPLNPTIESKNRRVTSDSGRRPCWLRPCDAYLRAS